MFNMGDKKPTIEGTQFLIVGIPGSGKSSALASFATEKNPMYVFDCDARLDGILASTWLKPHYKYIDADIYETRLGFKAVRAKFLEFYNLHQAGKLKYKNIVVDSVSSLSQMFLQDAQFQKANKPTPQSAQSAAKQLGFEEAKFETIDEYKYVLKCFHILFYDFFKSFPGVNLFLSCWTADQWGKSPNDPYGPDIKLPGRKLFAQGNVVNELPG